MCVDIKVGDYIVVRYEDPLMYYIGQVQESLVPTPVEGNCEITAIFNYARAASNTTAVQSSSLCSNDAKHVLVVKTRSKSEIEVIDREQIVEVVVPLTSEELGSHASGSSRQQKSLLTFKVSVDTDKFPEK